MRIKVDKIINCLIIFKFISPLIAIIYLGGWLLQGVNNSLFLFIDFIFGFLPHLIDKFHLVKMFLFGDYEVTMGYAYAGCVFMFFYYFSNLIIGKLEKINKLQKNEELKKRHAAQLELKKKRLEQLKKQKKAIKKPEQTLPEDRKVFFGLFEFVVSNLNGTNKDETELRKLKEGFSKIMVAKLKESYPDAEYNVEDKIFFVCNDFSKLRSFTKTILTLFKTFMETGLAQSIRINMLFSYWTENDASRKEKVYNILKKVNELGYVNKIIVSGGVYFRFLREKDKGFFDFEPLGAAKLFNVFDGKDLDLDLYSIIKVE